MTDAHIHCHLFFERDCIEISRYKYIKLCDFMYFKKVQRPILLFYSSIVYYKTMQMLYVIKYDVYKNKFSSIILLSPYTV